MHMVETQVSLFVFSLFQELKIFLFTKRKYNKTFATPHDVVVRHCTIMVVFIVRILTQALLDG